GRPGQPAAQRGRLRIPPFRGGLPLCPRGFKPRIPCLLNLVSHDVGPRVLVLEFCAASGLAGSGKDCGTGPRNCILPHEPSVALMFNWNDLKYLLAVADQGSTLSAARKLGVDQSTVQRRLAELEGRLGLRLVERSPSGYRLT